MDEKLIFKHLNTSNAPQFAGHFLFWEIRILRNNLLLALYIFSMSAFAQNWWSNTSIYQVYPRSFYDTNRDGIADIKGISEKFDYIQSLGFETVLCSPFFTSPQKDFGELIFRLKQIHSGVILVRLSGVKPLEKAKIILAAIEEHGAELAGAFTVINKNHIKIRKQEII